MGSVTLHPDSQPKFQEFFTQSFAQIAWQGTRSVRVMHSRSSIPAQTKTRLEWGTRLPAPLFDGLP